MFGHIFHTLGWSCKSWSHPYCQSVPIVSLASDRFVAEGYTWVYCILHVSCVLCIDCIDSHRYTDHIHGMAAWHDCICHHWPHHHQKLQGPRCRLATRPLQCARHWERWVVGWELHSSILCQPKKIGDCALKQGFTKEHRHF